MRAASSALPDANTSAYLRFARSLCSRCKISQESQTHLQLFSHAMLCLPFNHQAGINATSTCETAGPQALCQGV